MGPAPDDVGPTLLRLARDAIEEALGVTSGEAARGDLTTDDGAPWLDEPGAAFVTLSQAGHLRGCIGSLTARRPLREDVRENAVASAVADPRFLPLEPGELPITDVAVSVLSAPEPFPVASEADAVARLRPGVDGLVVEYGPLRATFLPQVWEQLPDPAEFLGHLKRKAGLPRDFWHCDIRLARYTVETWSEASDDARDR